ncbi:uncharacterized protein N7482_009018 [Penicillium canariense]|uniref:Major facilitator superfamily (MFS) profile domain-containing protein n=1 Tax=Penicillium canariense TaxID=189055 RepID=A0A9W9LJ38_9EURO|nr:uncharacterized protein N7482_009018 [Penicillium canariense]KAJ5157918.1 hypothetical protein N7482_009018 [Penicillium canariense]
MGFKEAYARSPLGKYREVIRLAPREVIYNGSLILSAILYAMSAVPMSWDQGSSAVVPSLPGFQNHFHITSGANASQIRNFVSLVFIGMAAGAASSFLLNDLIGRLWSFRLYQTVWIIGQIVAIFATNLPTLWAARIISGLGIGALSVTGPMSIVEIAPAEIRGLLTSWFVVAMATGLFVSIFCVYGLFLHHAANRLQYQIVWFAPCIFIALWIIASFYLCESPRWLMMVGRRADAIKTLTRLRGLPEDHPRVQAELSDIEQSINSLTNGEKKTYLANLTSVVKETFTSSSNVRRVIQTVISYGLAQLSGANAVTSYLMPILEIIGVAKGNTSEKMFISGMYGMAKFFIAIIASFFFIDALGRRRSLFIGVITQMISDIYIGVFIKYKQDGNPSNAASTAAIAAIFIHAFGYYVGLCMLPYIFGGEVWPNRIRSFGGALSQTFHWAFSYGLTFGMPSILSDMNNWGAFLFFAGWCFTALCYVYLMVPELSGLSVEEVDNVFKGPWLNARRSTKHVIDGVDDVDRENFGKVTNNGAVEDTKIPVPV